MSWNLKNKRRTRVAYTQGTRRWIGDELGREVAPSRSGPPTNTDKNIGVPATRLDWFNWWWWRWWRWRWQRAGGLRTGATHTEPPIQRQRRLLSFWQCSTDVITVIIILIKRMKEKYVYGEYIATRRVLTILGRLLDSNWQHFRMLCQ